MSLAMIAANNHYAGFGPGTANLFRKMVGLSELSWADQQQLQKILQLQQQREVINKLVNQTFLQKNTPRNDRVVSQNL